MSSNNTFDNQATADPSARYRAIQVEAVLALIAGVCSLGLFFDWLFILFPVAAVVFGYRAIQAIERTPEEYTGQELAKIGIVLGLLCGVGLSAYRILHETRPSGYIDLQYADLEPDMTKTGEFIPAKVMKLSEDKTRVYIEGYILPGTRLSGLKEFSICRTADMCRFGVPNTKKRELIRIKLTGDLVMDYTSEIIGVGGVFKADPDDPNGMPYSIEADYIYR